MPTEPSHSPPTAPPKPQPSGPAPSASDDKGFFEKHYGNPEKDEVYGVTSNDYETEPEQIQDQKRTAGQAIWYLVAFAVVTYLAYLVESR